MTKFLITYRVERIADRLSRTEFDWIYASNEHELFTRMQSLEGVMGTLGTWRKSIIHCEKAEPTIMSKYLKWMERQKQDE